jgi:hypothetical protein
MESRTNYHGQQNHWTGGALKLAHLLGNDFYNVLENTVNPDLRKGFQAPIIIIVAGRPQLESEGMHPGTKKCIYKCFSLPHPGFFHGTAQQQGGENHNLLVNNEC